MYSCNVLVPDWHLSHSVAIEAPLLDILPKLQVEAAMLRLNNASCMLENYPLTVMRSDQDVRSTFRRGIIHKFICTTHPHTE